MSPGSRAVVDMQRNDITPDLLKQLAQMRAPGDARMISTYLDLDPSAGLATKTARRTAVTSLVDQARRMATAHKDGLSHAARMQLRADVARIEGLLIGRVIDDGLAEGAHAIAVFACQPTDLLEAVRLPRAVGERVMIARRPAIRPLVEIGPPPIWAVLLTDGDDARLLEGHGDRLEEVERLRTRLPRRSGHGIWAPDHDERAVGKDERRHLRRAVELLADHARGRRYDAFAVGTSPRLWAVIEDELPAELRERLLGRLDIDADESRPAEVRARVEPLLHAAAQARRRRVANLLSGPRAVHGLWSALAALQERRVQTLVVAPWAQHPGTACPRCNWATAQPGACPIDGAQLEPEPDLVDLAVAEAVVQAADVEILDDEHRIGADGLAAILRHQQPVKG